EAILLSTAFVGGIVTLFTPLLVISALSGTMWGQALANKWVIYGLSTFFAAMAAAMFGAFDLTLPDSVMQRVSSVGGTGYRGAFILGLVCGIVATPCTGPVLGSMIAWIAQTHNVVMAIVALYYLKNAIPALTRFARPDNTFMAICGGVVALGLALGAVHLYWDDGGVMVKARKGAGIALCVGGGFLLVAGWQMPKGSLTWEHSEELAVAKARSEKRPMLIDFTATWCGACQELAKDTFADPRVMEKAVAENFVAVK